jgi:2,5-diketo-D-gluconate reductase A
VTLRWHFQRGGIIFPKSMTPERIKENFEMFDFEVTEDDVAAISALAKGEPGRTGRNPDVFAYMPR